MLCKQLAILHIMFVFSIYCIISSSPHGSFFCAHSSVEEAWWSSAHRASAKIIFSILFGSTENVNQEVFILAYQCSYNDFKGKIKSYFLHNVERVRK